MDSPYPTEKKAVVDAVLNLFAASQSASFLLPIPGTNPKVYIAAGGKDEIRQLLETIDE